MSGNLTIDGTLTIRQANYARYLFEGKEQAESYRLAGYKTDKMTLATLYANASRLANSDKVLARIEELNKAAEDASIADVKERKKYLTEIIRGRLGHFINADGNLVELTEENLKSAALQDFRIAEFTHKDGSSGKTTVVKLKDGISAVDLLNKMDKLYAAEPSVVIDNRTLNVHVISQKSKDLTERLIEGERTGGDS